MGPFLFGLSVGYDKVKGFNHGGHRGPQSKPALLENPPYKMGQQGKQGEHEDATHPDQEVQRHPGIVDLFLVHAVTLARAVAGNIGWVR
jgi:hypothetical protein